MEPPTPPFRVLLAEPDSKAAAAFQAQLNGIAPNAFKVTVRSNRTALIDRIDRETWDAVVLDLGLAEANERELLHTLCTADDAPPVIILGTVPARETDLACMRAGAAGFLCKDSLTPETLERTLRYTIRHAREARKLEESVRLRDHFLSLLAHDIRGPAGILSSGLSFYAEHVQTLPFEKVERFLRQAEDEAQGILTLTDRILEWARTQSSDLQPEKVLFAVQGSVDTVLQGFRSFTESKRITVRTAIGPAEWIEADPNMWDSVLRNLLSNAIKFSPPGSEIEVETRQSSQRYQLIIRDAGIGMNDELRRNLLNGRSVEARPGTRNEKGTGFGMQLCRRFIQLHGGEIDLRPAKKQGTEVIIALPLSCLKGRSQAV